MVGAHGVGQLGQIAAARRRHDHVLASGDPAAGGRQHAGFQRQAAPGEGGGQPLVEHRHAIVIEARRLRAIDRHLVRLAVPLLAVALHLLGHVAPGVLRALAVELVDGDDVGEVEHVDLLELARRAELARHDVERGGGEIDDLGVGLADAGGLDDDEVVAGGLGDGDRVFERARGGHVRLSGGERAHVDAAVVDGVHADAIAQQRAAGLALGGVDREDRDRALREVVQVAPHQFVGEAALAGAAGAGDAQDGRLARFGQGAQGRHQRLAGAVLGGGDGPGDRAGRADLHRTGLRHAALGHAVVTLAHHLVDHALEAQQAAVFRREDLRHAVGLELGDLGRHDHAAAAAVDADVAGAALFEQVDHVLEVLDVAALVAGERDAVRVLLNRGVDDLGHRAVVAQVDHLDAGGLQDAAHDVDAGVVAVEQRGRGDEADLVDRLVGAGARDGAGGGGFHGHPLL
ncbi:hypothetical protein D3C72_814750 [compost metagenome]